MLLNMKALYSFVILAMMLLPVQSWAIIEITGLKHQTSSTSLVIERGMTVHIQVGTPEAPSIAVALEKYLKVSNRS